MNMKKPKYKIGDKVRNIANYREGTITGHKSEILSAEVKFNGKKRIVTKESIYYYLDNGYELTPESLLILTTEKQNIYSTKSSKPVKFRKSGNRVYLSNTKE
jgi:hypothetical protein